MNENKNSGFVPKPVYIQPEAAPAPAPDRLPFAAAPVRRHFSRLGLAYSLMLVLYGGAQMGLQAAMLRFVEELGHTPQWLARWGDFLLLLPFYVLAVPFCLLVLNGMPTDPRLRQRHLSGGMYFAAVAMSVSGMLIGSLAANALMALVNMLLPNPAQNAVQTMLTDSDPWLTALFVCVITPFMEELTFRKLLIDRTAIFGDRAAILLSGLMFGLFHGNFYQFFYAFLLGCLFAWVYVRSGRLYLTVLLHGFINFLGGIVAPWMLRLVDLEQAEAMTREELLALPLTEMLPLAILGLYELALMGVAILGVVLFFVLKRKLVTEPGFVTVPKGRGFFTLILNPGMALFVVLCLILFVMSLMA